MDIVKDLAEDHEAHKMIIKVLVEEDGTFGQLMLTTSNILPVITASVCERPRS